MSVDAGPGGASVDQILFRWSEVSLSGHKGMGPVASSLDSERVRLWEQRLKNLIWGAPADGAALVFQKYGDQGAVVRRVAAQDPTGRAATLAHALVGPGLDEFTALGLAAGAWPGWIGIDDPAADGTLPAVGLGELEEAADGGLAGLGAAAQQPSVRALARVVAAALADPAAEFTLVAPGTDGPVLLHALIESLTDVVPGPFTFSTFQPADTDPDLPRFVVLQEPPQFSMHTTCRRRILLHEEAAAPGSETDSLGRFAFAWSRLYRNRGVEALRGLRPDRPCLSAQDVSGWVRTVSLAEGVLADVVDLLERAAVEDGLDEKEHALLARGLDPGQVERGLGELAAASLRSLAVKWRTTSMPYTRYPQVGSLIHDALGLRLVHSWDPQDADAVCQALTRQEELVGRLAQWCEIAARSATGPTPTQQLTSLASACMRFDLNTDQAAWLLTPPMRGMSPDQLLGWIHDMAAHSPTQAYLVAGLVDELDPGAALQAADQFARLGGLTSAIGAMTPSTPNIQLQLLESFVVRFAGRAAVNNPDYLRRLVSHCGEAPAALLHVLWRFVENPAARDVLHATVAYQYFAGYGLPQPVAPSNAQTRARIGPQVTQPRSVQPHATQSHSDPQQQPAAQQPQHSKYEPVEPHRFWDPLMVVACAFVLAVIVVVIIAMRH